MTVKNGISQEREFKMARITEKQLMMKLLNHNAWTNGSLLDFDSLGASGGMGEHLILFNT